MKFTTIPVLTVSEFRQQALKQVLDHFENDTKEAAIECVFHLGFHKFDPDNLEAFIKALPGFIMFDTVLVETNLNNIFWFVSGDRAVTCSFPP